ncbi:NADH:ubiquinone reductase (Na(+)-transporting) subunit C [Crocinitomix catalasitica]|nr:NADH:ubiquinone reductase (Na(+)-transporting) subunit C [Crocinitomix catalasitica]
MAVNKEGTGYTFIFSILLVVVVGVILAILSIQLKPLQDANDSVKKKMDILSALKIDSDRKNGEELYKQYIDTADCVVLNSDGVVIDGDADDIDIKKEYKNKNLAEEDRNYPLYIATVDGDTKYIIPVVGSGLWGPIWGFIAIDGDESTVYGAKFDHKTETPGLGAEINRAFFYDQYAGESITTNGVYKKIKVVKDGSGTQPGRVDGITGGTITSKGVEEMVDRTIQVYIKYFNKN